MVEYVLRLCDTPVPTVAKVTPYIAAGVIGHTNQQYNIRTYHHDHPVNR